jgi:transposase-like protein
MTKIEELNAEQLEQPSVELVEDDVVEVSNNITLEQVVVIAKLSNGKYHQVMVTNAQVDTLINALDQICEGIRVSEQELTGVQFE